MNAKTVAQRERGRAIDDGPLTTKEIGQHLRRMREVRGLSVEEAAKLSGRNAWTIYGWEQGRDLAKVQKVLAQFNAYGCVVKILPEV